MTGIILGIAILVLSGGFLYLKIRIDKAVSGDQWLGRIQDEIDQLVLEMNQTAERNVALLEDRIKALQNLLEEADRKLMLLQKESEKTDLSRQVYSHLKQKAVIPPEPGDEAISVAHAPAAVSADSSKPARPASLRDQVMELYSQGFSAEIISQKLKSSIAEVDLIISLHTGPGGEG